MTIRYLPPRLVCHIDVCRKISFQGNRGSRKIQGSSARKTSSIFLSFELVKKFEFFVEKKYSA
jgi:hypothetical protein